MTTQLQPTHDVRSGGSHTLQLAAAAFHCEFASGDRKLLLFNHRDDDIPISLDWWNLRICCTDTGNDDSDSMENGFDNCPHNANRDQADTDGDGVGNACDLSPLGRERNPGH